MNITFGIIVGPNHEPDIVRKLIDSIFAQDFEDHDYEIIVCGNYESDPELGIKVIPFDESQKRGWITRKKNLIAKAAKYDTLCILHDYYLLDKDWYQGVLKYSRLNRKWNVLCSRVLRLEGDRHSDWLINQKYMDQILAKHPELGPELMAVAPTENNGPRWVCALPYWEIGLWPMQYVSGGYILARTNVFREIPFDERYGWGEAAEDIIWSEQVIEHEYKISFNPYSLVTLQKPGKWRVHQMTEKCVELLKEMFLDGDRI
jgi:hypothetical protein